jgi:hypothetical protein
VIEWLDEFYGSDDLRNSLQQSFLPLFASYAATITQNPSDEFVAALVASFVDRYLGSSRAQLQEVVASEDPLTNLAARFDEWREKRPSKVALNETVRAANALAVEEMRSAGVTRKVWRSSGGSCPYCRSLNGKVLEIEQHFFEPGDELNPDGADEPLTFTSAVGHPPCHQGCDCSVVPG